MDIAASLAAIADQRDASGKKRFSHEDIVHFMPLLLLGAGVDYRRYPPLARIMQKFAVAVGLRTDMGADVAVELVRDYYRRSPPNRNLVRAIRALVREISLEGMSAMAAPDLSSLLDARSAPPALGALAPPASWRVTCASGASRATHRSSPEPTHTPGSEQNVPSPRS